MSFYPSYPFISFFLFGALLGLTAPHPMYPLYSFPLSISRSDPLAGCCCCWSFPGGRGCSARIYAAFHGDGRCPPFRVPGCGFDYCCRPHRLCRGGGVGQRLGRRVFGAEGTVTCHVIYTSNTSWLQRPFVDWIM